MEAPSELSSIENQEQLLLPQLTLNLHQHKLSITLHWSALLLVSCILPEAFFFGLKGTDQSTKITIPMSILLVFTVLTVGLRTFRLLRKSSQCRPLGGKPAMLDYFNWNMILGFIIVTAVLVQASEEEPPNIRRASLPQTIVLYIAGTQVLVTAIMSTMGWPCSIRMSSTPAGSMTKPGVYVLTEDICGVDGGGGEKFRQALQDRFEASPIFRQMMFQVNWFWGVGTLLVAVGLTVLVELVDDTNVSFALGWSIPWGWAGFGTFVTILWVRKSLVEEVVKRRSESNS